MNRMLRVAIVMCVSAAASVKAEGGSPAGITSEITVKDSGGACVQDAEVALVDRDKGVVYSATYTNGAYSVKVPTEKPLVLAIAHKDYCGEVKPLQYAQKSQTVVLEKAEKTGSVILKRATCTIVGFKGRLNIIRDEAGTGGAERLYVYATNIAIDGGKNQPVTFDRLKPLLMEDVDGKRIEVKVLEVIGRFSILEYRFL